MPGLMQGLGKGLENLIKRPGTTMYRSLAPNKTMSIAKGMFTDPVNTLKKGWNSKKFGLLDKTLLGAFVAPDVLSLGRQTQPGEEGKAERAGRALGSLAGGIAFSRVPMIGNMLGWTAGSMGGALAGKTVGKVTGVGKAKPALPAGAEEPSLADKLNKVGSVHKKLREFARKKIRDARFKEVEPNQIGDITTATWRDPTGTFERVSATENKPHA